MAPKGVVQMSLITVTTRFGVVDIPRVHKKPGLVERWGGCKGGYPSHRSKEVTSKKYKKTENNLWFIKLDIKDQTKWPFRVRRNVLTFLVMTKNFFNQKT